MQLANVLLAATVLTQRTADSHLTDNAAVPSTSEQTQEHQHNLEKRFLRRRRRRREEALAEAETTTTTTTVEDLPAVPPVGPFDHPSANYEIDGPIALPAQPYVAPVIPPPCPETVVASLPNGIPPVAPAPYVGPEIVPAVPIPGPVVAPIPVTGPLTIPIPYEGVLPAVAPVVAPITPPIPYEEVAPVVAPIPPPIPYEEVAPIVSPIPPPIPYEGVAPVVAPIPPPIPYHAPTVVEVAPVGAPMPLPYDGIPPPDVLPGLVTEAVPYDSVPGVVPGVFPTPIIDVAPIGVPGEIYPPATPCESEGLIESVLPAFGPGIGPGLYGGDLGLAPFPMESVLPIGSIYNSAKSFDYSALVFLIVSLI